MDEAVKTHAETDERLHQPNKPELAVAALPPEEQERLTEDIVAALKSVYDPEIPSDIYELGLIYKVEIDDSKFVAIDMTLTAPACPVAGEMPKWVEDAVAADSGERVCSNVLSLTLV